MKRPIKTNGKRMALGLILALSVGVLSACDSLLEVDLPHILTDAALEGPTTVETQVNSAIALFECGMSGFAFHSQGGEDVQESIAGAGANLARWIEVPEDGECDTTSQTDNWFDQIAGARALLSNDPDLMVPSAEGAANGAYDKLNNQFSLGDEGERLSAISAIYVAAGLGHFGEFMCEIAIDGSELLTPTEVVNLALDWTDRALTHVNNIGDFTMPHGIASSARNMAIGLRARYKWVNRDYAGAAQDAATIPDGFVAYVTRDTGEQRRNKTYHAQTEIGFAEILGVIDWWDPAGRAPNPVTGQLWPNPIPFTGYRFLGIMPDGRALEPGNTPVAWAEEERVFGQDPVPLNNGAVPDTRVTHIKKPIQGPEPAEVQNTYSSEDEDEPYVTWQEMRFYQAYNAHQTGNLRGAIDMVNLIRAARGLPLISGAYETALLADADEVRWMLLEEARRVFFSGGGRYLSVKIQNTDVLWFPRNQGTTPFQGYQIGGLVRYTFDADEYIQNPKWAAAGGQALKGTGCTSLPGSQAPVPT